MNSARQPKKSYVLFPEHIYVWMNACICAIRVETMTLLHSIKNFIESFSYLPFDEIGALLKYLLEKIGKKGLV